MDGAPGQVHALAQTTDGYLWLGTATGLFRFDGIRFQPYEPSSGQAFPQRNVYSLFAAPDGGLWVGYWYGGVSLIKNGRVTNYGKEEGLPSHAVLAFARDRQGAMWIACGISGLARLEGSHWIKIGADWGFADSANTVFVDRDGTIWAGTTTRVEYLREGAKRFQIAAEHLRIVMKIAEAPDGTLWMAETDNAVRPVPLPWKRNAGQDPEIDIGSQAILFDNQGSLWITSLGDGIRRIPSPEHLASIEFRKSDPELEPFTHENGLTANFIYCVLQDHEGNIWIGTSGGLDRFRQSAFVSVPAPKDSSVSALIAGERGALWATSVGPNLLTEFQNDKAVSHIRGPYFDCAYRDPQGLIWLATPEYVARLDDRRSKDSHPGEITYTYEGSVTSTALQGYVAASQAVTLRKLKLPTQHGIAVSPQSRVRAMTEDRSGKLWISMHSGTFRLEKSAWTSLESLGGPQGMATSEFTGSDGRVWFGFANTVAMLNEDIVTTFSGRDGVQVGAVTSIQSDGQRIWIGGEFGLEYFDGTRFRQIIPGDGSSFGGVFGIIADPGNGLWFSDKGRVIHIPESELRHLDARQTVAFQSYDKLDGLNAELASPSVAQTTDGRIWFATTNGLVWIDPKRIPRNTVPPPVLIESVIANRKPYNTSTPLTLPPRTTNLQIAYTATSLTIPERVRFRYKLEGQDKDWQDCGMRREAFYTNLDPGSYQFRVVASNNDGVWNETGASLRFVVLPAFDQTVWFRILCILAAAGCLWSLYLLRLRQATARVQQRLGARMEERERIARELHDTLLQGFQGLVLRFQAVVKTIPEQHPARNMLESVLDRADQVIVEGRDRVRDLRQEDTSGNELPDMLATFTEELRQDHGSSFSLTVVGTQQALDPTVSNEAYRIGREALINAFRHSHSSKIEVEIIYDHSRVRLSVRDNGVGINQEMQGRGRIGHWGVPGMRERAQELGGHLTIWSLAGAGTEVELTIPAAVAYPFKRARSRWYWIKRLIRPGR